MVRQVALEGDPHYLLFPLLTVGFLLVATTRNNWTIVARGFLSAYAVMGVLASRVFTVRFPMHRTEIRMTLVAAAIASGIALFGYLSKGDLPYSTYLEVALAPALMGLALALMFLSQSREHSGWAVFGLLTVAIGFSAMLNVRAAVPEIDRYGYRYRFALPLALRYNIELDQPFDAYVSWGSLERISGAANTREVAGIFNVALDGQTDRTEYQIGNINEHLLQSMESVRHMYVVINASEWEWMRTAPQDRPEWRDRYEAFAEPGGRYVLLTLIED